MYNPNAPGGLAELQGLRMCASLGARDVSAPRVARLAKACLLLHMRRKRASFLRARRNCASLCTRASEKTQAKIGQISNGGAGF